METSYAAVNIVRRTVKALFGSLATIEPYIGDRIALRFLACVAHPRCCASVRLCNLCSEALRNDCSLDHSTQVYTQDTCSGTNLNTPRQRIHFLLKDLPW